MANIKSAKKRVLVIATKTARNKSIKSAVKTAVKKVDAAVAAGDKAAAQTALANAISTMDKAASKLSLIHIYFRCFPVYILYARKYFLFYSQLLILFSFSSLSVSSLAVNLPAVHPQ